MTTTENFTFTTITDEAVATITRQRDHLRSLRDHYGEGNKATTEALDSWASCIARLFSLKCDSIWAEDVGGLSLGWRNATLVGGMIWHGKDPIEFLTRTEKDFRPTPGYEYPEIGTFGLHT